MKEVRYLPEAAKSLRRHSNIAARIRAAVAEYESTPGAHANQVKALAGSPYRRLSVGDFRVIFAETDSVVTVLEIGPRGSVYE